MRLRQKQQRKSKHQISPDSLLNRKIVSPQKLKILVLAGNELLNQHLEFLQKCVNLIKLDLSHNHITKLPEKIGFQNLKKLEVLQLHYNRLAGVDAIECIFNSSTLIYLTYHHNPMEGNAKNEHTVINMIPTLKLLNNRIVYVEERSDCLLYERPITLVDSQLFENWKSTENSEAYYLKVLNMQLQFIDNVWAFNNPIIFIQRAWRHFLPQRFNTSSKSSLSRTIRSKITSRKDKTGSKINNRKEVQIHPLKQCFEEWKKFSTGLSEVRKALKNVKEKGQTKDKTYLLQPLQDYFQILRNMRVEQPLKRMIKHIRRKIYEKKMAYVLMANLKMKNILFEGQYSFYHVSGVSKCNRIYYNRNQQHLIDNFLAIIAERFNKREIIYSKSNIQVNKQFNAIRLVDPESFMNKYNTKEKFFSFCSMMWPSMKVVAINRKKNPGKFKAGIVGIRQLGYVRNTHKVVTKAQFKKSVDVYKRLQKFAQNEYEQSMWYFQCSDPYVMKQLLRHIYYHNTKALKFDIKTRKSEMLSLLENYQQPFIFYVESVLKRTCAAVAIQKTWRRFISNKNQKQSIYSKMKKNRAALHIQHFYRDRIYRHRTFFTNKLYKDLAFLKTATIIYPLEFYLNINTIYNAFYRGKLFRNVKLTTKNGNFGVNQQFYRSIFHPSIRQTYFDNRKIGLQNYQEEIDIHHLIHCKADIKLITRGHQRFISFSYRTKAEAAIVSSLIALFSYQIWGKCYVFPLTRENTQLWQSRINEYRKVHLVSKVIKPFEEINDYVLKEIRQSGAFISRSSDSFQKDVPTFNMNVEFYQKRYHNFPLKNIETLSFRFVNAQEMLAATLESTGIKIEPLSLKPLPVKQEDEKAIILPQNNSKKGIKDNKDIALNITTIDKARFSLFDHSEKHSRLDNTIKSKKSQLQEFSKTAFVVQQAKRDKVMRFYKEEVLKRQAQREVKQVSLAALREKAKQERIMNATVMNMKELERTENLRNKVNRVKELKNRLSVNKREEEVEFIQQNNFVMEQQLRMVIMRTKMKQAQNKKEESLASRKMSTEKQSEVRTIQSRKSSKQRVRVEEEEIINNSNLQANVIGDEGSIINVKKKVKKPRANSIGAYIRDPSFVHGVFPEEYYPIESRSTSFYFPPVI